MPYLRDSLRHMLEDGGKPIEGGELNFLITQVVWGFIKDQGLTYKNINTCIGALECAKLELYRQVAAGYEDDKRRENGDVYV